MKKILVPCDFSKPAINAFKFALDVAERSGGTVILVHVIELPVLHDTALMPVLSFEEQLLKELKENASAQFKKIIEKNKRERVKIFSHVEFGPISRRILEMISAQSVDVVIMGSHGASGLREYFIGSKAEKIIRKSPVPVLVTKDYYEGPIKNIVFPNSLDKENQAELRCQGKGPSKILQGASAPRMD
jgi:nucleotide-binding universal stress UspA family protein